MEFYENEGRSGSAKVTQTRFGEGQGLGLGEIYLWNMKLHPFVVL